MFNPKLSWIQIQNVACYKVLLRATQPIMIMFLFGIHIFRSYTQTMTSVVSFFNLDLCLGRRDTGLRGPILVIHGASLTQ